MLLQKLCCRAPSKQKQIMRRDTGYSRFYAERSVLYIIRHRILVAALASLASRCNQASLRLAKGWIAFTNGIFDSREPPIWVPVTARPQDSQPAIRTTPTFFYAPGFSSLRSLRSLHDITKDAFGVPKGWIAFTNGIFDSWEPPILVPVAARPQDSRYAWPKSKLRPQLYNISQEI